MTGWPLARWLRRRRHGFDVDVVHGLASLALGRAIAGELDDAAEAILAIGRAGGSQAVAYAMCGWADTTVDRLYPDRPDAARIAAGEVIVRLRMADQSGAPVDADDADPRSAWAARFIAARAACDHDTGQALLDVLPWDDRPAEQVWVLLGTCAGNIAALRDLGAS